MQDKGTYIPDTDYFFLGDGRIVAAIQWSRARSASPYGLLLWNSEHMARKEGTWLYHPELGLSRTMLTAIVDGKRYTATHDNLQATWELNAEPTVILRWNAETIEITERIHVRARTSELVRHVFISAPTPDSTIAVEVALYANPILFDQFGTLPEGSLHADGYASVRLTSVPQGRAFERFLTVPLTGDTTEHVVSFVYSPGITGQSTADLGATEIVRIEQAAIVSAQRTRSSDPVEMPEKDLATRIRNLYEISRISLRATVARSGKFDASIWQYTFEWGMDAAMIATAAVCSGEYQMAREVLERILTKLSNEEGMIAESSRFRSGELSELNGNGAVLDAISHYTLWTGDSSLYTEYRQRIAAIADYPLREEFQHPSGLLRGRRDLWERLPWMGVQPGFELSHQTFCHVGLQSISWVAEQLGDIDSAERWRAAAERIVHGMLHDPVFSMIENGHFIHRRLLDGSVQKTMTPSAAYRESEYAPYVPELQGKTEAHPCEPDTSEVLPLIYGLVDPQSDVAITTLEHLESLWSPTGQGGYARCNTASDPDSPGPWAFPTAFIAAAEIESGLRERTDRSLRWLLDMADAGGSWFEYYGERGASPYPPIGIIVWGWAQFILLFIRHILGIQHSGDRIRIRPRMTGITHRLRFGAYVIQITVQGLESAQLDGEPIRMNQGEVYLSTPLQRDHRVEFLPFHTVSSHASEFVQDPK